MNLKEELEKIKDVNYIGFAMTDDGQCVVANHTHDMKTFATMMYTMFKQEPEETRRVIKLLNSILNAAEEVLEDKKDKKGFDLAKAMQDMKDADINIICFALTKEGKGAIVNNTGDTEGFSDLLGTMFANYPNETENIIKQLQISLEAYKNVK